MYRVSRKSVRFIIEERADLPYRFITLLVRDLYTYVENHVLFENCSRKYSLRQDLVTPLPLSFSFVIVLMKYSQGERANFSCPKIFLRFRIKNGRKDRLR